MFNPRLACVRSAKSFKKCDLQIFNLLQPVEYQLKLNLKPNLLNINYNYKL